MLVLVTEARKVSIGDASSLDRPVKRRRLTRALNVDITGTFNDRSETRSLVGCVSGARSKAEGAKGRRNA
jgi:hypothetical protein